MYSRNFVHVPGRLVENFEIPHRPRVVEPAPLQLTQGLRRGYNQSCRCDFAQYIGVCEEIANL